MAVIRNLVVKITADVGDLSEALTSAQTALSKASAEFGKIGSTLATSITVPLLAIGTAAVSVAASFEQSMANAASVSGATGEELEAMTELAREMGTTTVFSASEAADAMYYMASAGYKAEQMAESLEPVLDLAAATQAELSFTTDTVISTLNQFGLEASDASKVTNTFAAVIGNSQATIDKLSDSMTYVAPVANALGYSIEETTAALGIMYNAGYEGSQAGTVLRSALSKLLDPTTEMTDTLAAMGLTYDDVNPETNAFADIIANLEGASMTAAQAVSIFGTEVGPGMLALVSQGSEALVEMEANITDTTAASTMAAVQLDTFEGSLKLLQSQLEEVAISIGDVLIPKITALIEKYVTPLIEKFNSLSEESIESAVQIGLIAAAIGPLFLAISKVLKLMSTFIQIAKLAFSPLTIKIALIVAAIVLLVSVFKNLYATNDEFKESVDSLLSSLAPIFEQLQVLGTLVMETVAKLFEMIYPLLVKIGEFLLIYIVNNMQAMMPVIEVLLSAFISLFSGIIKLLDGDFKGAFEDFKDFFSSLWEGIWMYLKVVINNMISLVNGFLSLVGIGINYIIGSLNSLQIDIPDWVPGIGGGTFGLSIPEVTMPQIPMLASGGVIPANSEFLAILGDQKSGTNIEAPLDTMVSAFKTAASEMQTGTSQSDIRITFDGTLASLIKLLAPKITQEQRKMGVLK